ncbi:MAG: hypothetical protein ACYC8T_09200 [Myxococcaceae bacterium]
MKTIAISIDEPTLIALDRYAAELSRDGGGKGKRPRNRSQIIRVAVQAFVAQQERLRREELERGVWAAHRARLNRQAAAVVADQAEP